MYRVNRILSIGNCVFLIKNERRHNFQANLRLITKKDEERVTQRKASQRGDIAPMIEGSFKKNMPIKL
jgi:hypothetical protein